MLSFCKFCRQGSWKVRWQTLFLTIFALVCSNVHAGAYGVDAQVSSYCAANAIPVQMPTASQWVEGTDGKVAILVDQPCWVRVQPHASVAESTLLITESVALHIQAFDAQGQRFARSSPGQPPEGVLLASRVVLLDLPRSGRSEVFLHITLDPTGTDFKQVETQLQWAHTATVMAPLLGEMSLSLLAAGALAFLVFLSCALAFALKRPLFALGGCASLINVLYLFATNGGYRALNLPLELFVYQGPVLLVCFGMLLLFIVEFCDFKSLAKKTAYLLQGMAALFIAAALFLLVRPDAFVGFDFYELLRLPAYLLILYGLILGLRQGQATAAMCLAALLPDYAYLYYYTLPHLHWLLGDTVMVQLPEFAQAGSLFELFIILWLPFMLCMALTHRVLTLERERARGALTDALTGLPNRAGLHATLSHLDKDFTAFVLDLNRFKSIDLALGRTLGDRVLQGFALRLRSMPDATVARLHSDRFAVVLPGHISNTQLKEQLEDLLHEPLQVEGQVVDLSATMGISNGQVHDTLEQHLRFAEVALHQAHQRHVAALTYDASMEKPRRSDLSLMSDLHRAVSKQELQLHLQPKVALADGTVHAAEGLVRWLHPQRGLVSPGEFVVFAEQIGRIGIITQWVLQEAMAITVKQRAIGLPLQISVNISAVDLAEENFVEGVARLAKETGAMPCDIKLEITESAAMENPDHALAAMHSLHALGFEWALDDFGTGYSSLSYLKKMPLSELKVDRSFLKDVTPDSDAARLLGSVIALGHQLGLTVVAEGAETRMEWDLLKDLGADVVQGWYAAKAMPQEEFFAWCREHPRFMA